MNNIVKAVYTFKLNSKERRQGEGSKAVLVRQEPVKEAEKITEMASNRGLSR